MWKKIWIYILLIVLLFGNVSTSKEIYATESGEVNRPTIVGAYSRKEDLQLLIKDLHGDVEQMKCLIASKNCQVKEYYGAKERPIRTLIILDVSDTIQLSERKIIAETVEKIIEKKADADLISIATMGEKLNYLIDYKEDRYDLLKAFERVEYKKQTTALEGGIYDAMETLKAIEDDSIKRVVVFSDAYYSNAEENKVPELEEQLKIASFPIFTIGCIHGKNKAKVNDNLYKLSKITLKESGFDLKKDTKSEEIMKYIDKIENYKVVTVIPDNSLLDGSQKALELTITMRDGMEYIVQRENVRMKMVEQAEAEPEPQQQQVDERNLEEEELPQNELEMSKIIPVIMITILPLIAAVVYFLYKKRKSKAGNVPTNSRLENLDIVVTSGKNVSTQKQGENITRNFMSVGEDIDRTVVLSREEHLESQNQDLDGTVVLPANQFLQTILLRDIERGRIFTKQLVDEIFIGRVVVPGYANMLLLDYDQSVSKMHCRIFIKDNEIYIEDLQSANHTFLNGVVIYSAMKVNSGDMIGIGNLKMQITVE